MSGIVRRSRAVVIFNPTAGRRRGGLFRRTLAELEKRGCAASIRETTRPGEAEEFARQALSQSLDLVVAAGGDGTVNEVVNGLAGGNLPLGLLPLGTSNVLAREIGLPGGAEAVAQVLAAGRERRIHLGLANGRRFAVMASVGLDSRVVETVSLRLKRVLGRGAYVAEAVRQWMSRRPATFTLTIDGRRFVALGAIVSNGRLYGGSFVCAPDARLETPEFQVVVFEPGGRGRTLRLALALLGNRLSRARGVTVVPAQCVELTEPGGEPVQGDGDLLTRAPATFRVAPDTLSLLVP